jgi:exonuclease SbcC
VEADEAHRRSGAAVAAAAARVATLEGQMAALDDELSDHPDAGVVATTLARLDAADAAVEEARSFEGRCRRELATAEGRVRAAEAAEREARRRFDAARDQVAGLGPPMPARADLVSDWDELVAWAGAAQQAAEEEGALAADAAAEAERRRRLVEQELEAAADACGVRSSGRRLGEAVAAAEAETEARSKQLAHAVAAAEQARARLAERRAAEQVARLLALHLRSDHFEKWLLDEALAELTSGANGLLEQLSGDAYSLTLDARTRDFAVVDHRNAGECRPVRTLSGGETFLASLALALALADRVAELAASGAARLEAVFLDEGFGTLDPDTLDTVAAAIENLGATGRMVGIVTHVRELAERVPLRFEVTKGPRSSRVDRVLA